MELFFRIFTLILTIFSGSTLHDAPPQDIPQVPQKIAMCGDAICQASETCSTCSEDCGLCEADVLNKIKQSVVWVKYEYFAEKGTSNYLQSEASGSGVIVDENENYLFILTNRHVLDCRFTNSCSRIWHENVTIRTQDGVTHVAEKISFDPEFLDIAYVRVRKANQKTYTPSTIQSSLSLSDTVIAAGYPAYKLGGGIVEYSSKSGEVKAIKELLLPNGRLLYSIESDAFTFYGSSGGGFFNNKGELIGISTWGVNLNKPSDSESIAIKINSLKPYEEFISCKNGEYVALDNSCQEYYGNTHRVVCFLSDQKSKTPLSGRVYYDDVNQGKTLNGCREIVIDNINENSIIEFDRDYAAGIKTYIIDYPKDIKQQFAISWFVE